MSYIFWLGHWPFQETCPALSGIGDTHDAEEALVRSATAADKVVPYMALYIQWGN